MTNKVLDNLKETNPNKYPSRMGEKWTSEEEKELLSEIQRKVPIELIADLHERTEGSISCKLRAIAVDFYFNKNLQIEQIQNFTGLSPEKITDAIAKSIPQKGIKERKQQSKKPESTSEINNKPLSDTKVMISLLTDIKSLLETLVQQKV